MVKVQVIPNNHLNDGYIRQTNSNIVDLIKEKKIPAQVASVQVSVTPPAIQFIKNNKLKTYQSVSGIVKEEVKSSELNQYTLTPFTHTIIKCYSRVNEFYIYSLRRIVI